MDRKTIKYFLDLADLTYQDVGNMCDPPVSRSAICQTISGLLNTKRIREAVALALNLKIEDIFSDGKPKRERKDAA